MLPPSLVDRFRNRIINANLGDVSCKVGRILYRRQFFPVLIPHCANFRIASANARACVCKNTMR